MMGISVLPQDAWGGSVTVAAGTLSCDYDTSDTIYSYPTFGNHGYMLLCGSDNQANPILDLGTYRWVSSLVFTNRSTATNTAIGTTQVYVAADDSTAFSDGITISDFGFAASSAASPVTSANTASLVRTLSLSRPMYCRYMKIVTTGNLNGAFTTPDSTGTHDRVQVGDLNVTGSAPSQTVTAGTVNTLGGRDALTVFSQFGTHGFAVSDSDGNSLIQLVVDQGSSKLVDMLQITNRADNASSFVPKTVRCLVAADESASGFDPQLLSSYTMEVGYGNLLPAVSTAGAVRSLDLTNVTRRYMLLVVSANLGSTLSPVQIGDIALTNSVSSVDVAAGTLATYDSTDILYDSSTLGAHGYTIAAGSDNQATPVLDLGACRWVSTLTFTNPSVTGNTAIGLTAVYAVPEETTAFTDGVQLTDFTFCLRSAVSPGTSTSVAGTERTLNLTQPIYTRYLELVTTSNMDGTLSSANNLVQVGELNVSGSVPSQTVTAGTVNALAGRDVVTAFTQFGTYGFAVSDTDGNSVVRLVVDQGSEKLIDMLQITNRADTASSFVPKTVRCLVAADESASGFDPQLLTGYTQEIGSGNLTPVMSTAGMVRSLDLTNVTRRYMLLEISANIGSTLSLTQIGDIAIITPPDSVNASDYGYDATDATSALQAAICTRAKVVNVPKMASDWIVTPIFLVDDQEIVFADGVNVVAKESEFQGTNDCLFTATEVSNLKLTGTNTVFKMQKSDYADETQYTTGEWRHGIKLQGCDNVTISGITVKETGGDGIYVGAASSDTSIPCSNIILRKVVCDNNYRQGMSVINVDTLTVDNCIFRATSGTAPMAGIDFESNNSSQVLTSITVTNSIFEANGSYGIEFCTTNLSSANDYDASIENCTFYGNQVGGLVMTNYSSSLVVKDSLFVNNVCGLANSDSTTFTTTYTGFWGNTSTTSGAVTLGTGCLTTIQPIFASTTYGDDDYMYLASNCPAAITKGASDGSYMGARSKVKILGDANLNGVVDVTDLSVLAAYYNTPSGATWAMGNFDGDEDVDVTDLSILAANYNSGSTSTLSWAEAYAQAFGTTSDNANDASEASLDGSEDTTSSVCSSLGLSLIAGLATMGLVLVKLDE
jgi:hypothetical protein